MQTKRLLKIFAPLFALLLAPAAQAVVVVGGDNDWEVSFDGNVNGFYVIEDSDAAPTRAASRRVVTSDGRGMDAFNGALTDGDVATVRRGGNITSDRKSSRIRTGLLPAFFSFNVRSPEVAGLRGSARISFAPQIQIDNTKNNFGSGQQAGAQIDMREVFFNIDGEFGTVSVGRTLSLHQRHGILTDMTLFGVGVQGGQGAGGTTLGRIGYGYVYPQFNARISYKTPQVNGFQLEIGVFDPSKIVNETVPNPQGGNPLKPGFAWTETSSPRFETEATYATTYTGGTVKAWLGGLWQTAEIAGTNNVMGRDDEVTAYGIHGGAVLGFEGFELTGSGYVGEALGTTLMLDVDAVDYCGEEREHSGYIIQGTYTFNGRTKFGVSYGASTADETDTDKAQRTGGMPIGACVAAATPPTLDANTFMGTPFDPNVEAYIGTEEQNALTVGLYHDVTSWFKVMAEYTRVEHEWFDGATQEADVFAVGSFFLW